MNVKTTIRKIVFVTVWLCIGSGMFILLLAAISKKNKGLCKDYVIEIKGVQDNFFIDKKDVEQFIMKETNGNIKGQPVASFRLHKLEQALENTTWISKAGLYFDNRDVLHIAIAEKEPVARIFTTKGNSFYIDSLGTKLPLSGKLSAKVPVFTGFPDKKGLSAKDSTLLTDIKTTAGYILNNPFWMAQVQQIDITPANTFEMIPLVGNHLVKLGDGENIDKKFHRLMVFYKQVLSKTGFDKYKIIDVQYKGQVVVSKYRGDARVDSVQLRKNVEKLLHQSIEAENDTITSGKSPGTEPENDSITVQGTSLRDETVNDAGINNNSDHLNSSLPVKPVEKLLEKPKENKTKLLMKENKPEKPAEKKKEPKAVMPKRPAEDTNGGYN